MASASGRLTRSGANRDVNLTSRGRPPESKLARGLARRIEDHIVGDGWRVGTIYASEDTLRERYGVSKSVLREAIRLVEHHGVAKMKRGPHGGLFILAPDAGPLTAAVTVYLEHVGTTVEDIMTARLLFEPLASRLAAERINKTTIETLECALHDERQDSDPDALSSNNLHNTLSRLVGNPAMQLFIDVLCRLTARYAMMPKTPEGRTSLLWSSRSADAHEEVAEAIIAGNPALAEMRMATHLEAVRDWLHTMDQKPITSHSSTSMLSARSTPPIKGKRAEAVAWQLMGQIAASGLPAGAILGSEPELQAHSKVSRAVFREAVRILEYHSVARMRRGQHGGLVITEPDPTACADAMAIYLEYEGVGPDHLRQVREIIELGALDLLLSKRIEPELIASLEDLTEHHSNGPEKSIATVSEEFHMAIVDCAANPILTLFVRIILTVWDRHYPQPSADPTVADRASRGAEHAHGRILDAISHGNLTLARRRMSNHLAALEHWWEGTIPQHAQRMSTC